MVLCLWASPVYGDQLEIVVKGVEQPLLGNVQARTRPFRISGNTRLSRRRIATIVANAEQEARRALRPFGFYHATVKSELRPTGDGSWEITLHLDRGPPIIVSDYRVEVTGPGAADESLLGWRDNWPLTSGVILNQVTWEEQKLEALKLAEEHGYLGAGFAEQVIGLDLERNQASLSLTLDTGEQAVMGSILFNQDIVNEQVLRNLPRWDEGQPYDAWLLEQFRLDLWRTGYFNNIEVTEERRLEDSPPHVNLVVNMESRNRNTYQGSFGYGTDTGIRLQAMWNRHLLSSRGDSLDVGVGWQDKYNELSFRTAYRQPRKVSARQYWTAEFLFKTENQEFRVRPSGDPDRTVTLAKGNVDDYSIRPGWLRIRGLQRGYQQIFETWYLQYLRERTNFQPTEDEGELTGALPAGEETEILGSNSESTSIGVSWDWPVVRGSGFAMVGHSHRARIFTSNTAWGSDLNFSQAYLSSRWNTIWNDRWKFLLRGEVAVGMSAGEEGLDGS